MHCYKCNNIFCAPCMASYIVLLTMISHNFANYSANATLLINWHITSSLNRIYAVPHWLIYQLFIDDIPCCASLLSHLCCAYNIKFQCTFWFCVYCVLALWLPVKLPCLCIHPYVSFLSHTLYLPMGRLQCYCICTCLYVKRF